MKRFALTVAAGGLVLGAAALQASNTSRLWTQYEEAKQAGGEPVLADFSFAGYHSGEMPIPAVDWKTFDVTRYGAVPNDGKSDKAAFVAAIAAAEANGSGVVFFPPGRFLINEPTDPKNEPILIRSSRVVLRGSGSGAGGSELFMNLHLDPTNPKKLYSCPFMIEFKGEGETQVETRVVQSARRETHSVKVADATRFKAGDWVLLHLQDNSPEAVAAAVAPYAPEPAWKKLIESGVMVDEFHCVEQVVGNRITFREPIHVEVDRSRDWKIIGYNPLEEVGVEELAFTGNWQGDFVHHRSFQDDSGWSGLALSKSVNSWIRNCRFTDWSRAVAVKACAAVTLENLVLEGNPGHNAVSLHNASHVLVRDVVDVAEHWHACGVAGKCSGNVFLNCEYSPDTCFESHASQPRWTLFDSVSGGWTYGRWGGAQGSQPNHMRGLVFWNYNNTGRGEPGDFHFMRQDSRYGRIIMPYVVGFHGTPQLWEESEVEELESNGRPVSPASLYEAQVELRRKKAKKKPNVLTIILDDAGWRDLGYMGGEIATPAIDRIAKQGIRLNKFYAYSTCTPTRAAFFTGQAPSRSGMVYPIQHDDHYGIPAEIDTLPEVFRRNGYKTALIGKWHLGVQQGLAPLDQGFDYHYGIRGGWTDQYTRENPKTGYDWWRNDRLAPREDGHTTDLLTADALRYLNQAGDDPFFLCLSFTAPHVPIQVDPKWAAPYEGRFDTRTRVGYAGMVAQLDDSIGRVFQTLERRGLLENTLVVLFSDNGPSAPGKKWYIPAEFFKTDFYGNDGVYGDVGPLRGWKAFPYDGGVRTPAFIYWKGKLTSRDWNRPVIVQDLYPTILSLAGLEGASEARNFLIVPEPEPFYWRTPKNLALLSGDWKLVVYNASPFEPDLHVELFNLAEDISESRNCAVTHPEKCAELLAALKSEFGKDAEPHVNQELLRREGK